MRELGDGMECTREPFLGWESIELKTGALQVNVVPELGGRIMNYQLGPHRFLWVHPVLAGQPPPAGGVGADGSWLNWGGDKLWLAPQGWENEEQWPGPPDPVLDGGPYLAEESIDEDGAFGLRLTSGMGAKSGMQLSRTLSIERDSSRLHVVATMKNIGKVPRRWSLWPVTQINAGNRMGDGWCPDLKTYVPVNPCSLYREGYRVIFGSEDNPQFKVAHGVVEAHYKRIVGKIGIDSDGGWVATVDGTTGNVLVQCMSYDAHLEYPDGASVEIWTNGLGTLSAYGRTEQMPDDVLLNPYLLECELLSPFATLAPEETAEFHYDWFAANIGVHPDESRRIVSCCSVGCTVHPLSLRQDGQLSGHFGVFYEGESALEFLASDGTAMGESLKLGAVSSLRPFVLQACIYIPEKAVTATLVLYRINGEQVGELARTVVSSGPC